MNDQELEVLYTHQLNQELVHLTRKKINKIIETYPHEFGLDNLFPPNNSNTDTMREKLIKLYQHVCKEYNDNVAEFDHVWVSSAYSLLVIYTHILLKELVLYLERTTCF
jgi:hypothetical protein